MVHRRKEHFFQAPHRIFPRGRSHATFSTESAESSQTYHFRTLRKNARKNIARQRRRENVLFGWQQRLCGASLGRSTAIDRRLLSAAVLKALALDLTDKLRKPASINWQNRQSARAKMLAMVKVVLAKHRYPPDKASETTEKVIAQAELLADAWAFEHP
ncbi:type I restriction enzyme endonuclease domain-containing protein [Geopseudomonas aromaticivorans]